jgi:hypothetical protein
MIEGEKTRPALYSREVICPLCRGKARELSDRKKRVEYHCWHCGYASNALVAKDPKRLWEFVPKELMHFVKWAQFGKNSATASSNRMPWWPEVLDLFSSRFVPVVVRRKLIWRRYDANIVGHRGLHTTLIEWPGRGVYAEYRSFLEARQANRQENRTRALLQRNPPKVRTFRSEKGSGRTSGKRRL